MTIAELELEATSNPDLYAGNTMKALVYHGPGKPAWENKPRPTIQHSGDAIVRVTTSTICGTDLHILKGDLPAVTDGRILGHEGIGIIEQVGTGLPGRYHPMTAKLRRLRSCSDCRPPLVHGRQECVVGTGSLHMLGLLRRWLPGVARVPLSLRPGSGGPVIPPAPPL